MMMPPRINIGRDFARALDPCVLARDCGIAPDSTQARLLASTARKILLNCCRQFGKSTTTALAALHTALYAAPALVILVSPSQQRSGELFRKIHGFWQMLPGAPAAEQESLTRLALENGSRIVSLPGSERTVRGYSAASLIVMDEASRVEDQLLQAVRPMLATTNGKFIALSTPAGKRGWFYNAWNDEDAGWERYSVRAEDCPRISKEFLAEELKALGPMRFAVEYECQFLDDDASAFSTQLIEQALRNDFAPF